MPKQLITRQAPNTSIVFVWFVQKAFKLWKLLTMLTSPFLPSTCDHLLSILDRFWPSSWSLGSECTYATPLSPHPVATTTRVLGMVIFRWFGFPKLKAKACQGSWRSVHLWVGTFCRLDVTDCKVLPDWKAMNSGSSSMHGYGLCSVCSYAFPWWCWQDWWNVRCLNSNVRSRKIYRRESPRLARYSEALALSDSNTHNLCAGCQLLNSGRRLQIKSINKAPCSSIKLMSLQKEGKGRETDALLYSSAS